MRTDPTGARCKPAITSTISGDLSVCDALQECATRGTTAAGVNNLGAGYYSIDLHWQISTAQWICVEYYQKSCEPVSGFVVADNDVGNVYGYRNLAY